MIKILGVCGSPRSEATEFILGKALESAQSVGGVETSMITLRHKNIQLCNHCDSCVRKNADRCVVYQDDMTPMYDQFYDADAYIIASPVYAMCITAQLAAFFHRFRYSKPKTDADPMFYAKKFGAAIAVGGTRNGGQELTIAAIHGFYHSKGITVVNSGGRMYSGPCVWTNNKNAQGAQEDVIAIENAEHIGEKIALLTKQMKGIV